MPIILYYYKKCKRVYSISFNIKNYQPQWRVQTFQAKIYHNNDKALPHDRAMTTHYHL